MVGKSRIEIASVRIGYRKRSGVYLLHEISGISFYAGDFVAVVGANGVGKSTFLRSVAGLQPVLGGEIRINGSDIKRLSTGSISRQVAIVLTQRFGGFNLRAADVVAAGRMPYTGPFHGLDGEHQEIVNRAAALCGIGSYLHLPVEELSDGMFQKTMIARAIAQQTDVLLLDEPGAFLDYASKHELFILLQKMAEIEKKCILVSSHDLDHALKYCSKVMLMTGLGVRIIDTADAIKDPEFLKIGGGFL